MINSFEHTQSAHCENGVVVNLLRSHGFKEINEPLAFGIGSGLFYVHIPFLKLNNAPAIAFRTMPGMIFKRTNRSLGIKYVSKKFKNEQKGKQFLNNLLDQNIKVGCQVGVFNLSYLPPEYRFHFNAHNIVVFGRENGQYLVSDSVMEEATTSDKEELLRARYSKGIYAPKGHLYYIKDKNVNVDEQRLKRAIVKGIKRNTRDMLHVPGPVAGVKGIKYTANKITKWREDLGLRKAGRYLGHIVRMQEEIGTGGGGFRFLYAAFLEQAAELLEEGELLKISDEFVKSGDLWRSAAIDMAGVYKGKNSEQSHFLEISEKLVNISEVEKSAFQKLSKLKLKL